MTIVSEERLSDSPYIETITRGVTVSAGSTIRPAESHWHMVLTRHDSIVQQLVVGPLTTAGVVSWGEGAEILWIKFKLGTFMPHLPTPGLLDRETILPEAGSQSFWLNGSAWQFPDYENADTFIDRLMRQAVLAQDPVISAALQDELPAIPSRATGLRQNTIRQMQRAQQARALLQEGVSILDTVEEAGYFDQPHLTRSLKQFIGYTPAQIVRLSQPDCHSVQDEAIVSGYDMAVLAEIR
jgi:hypothetical protein